MCFRCPGALDVWVREGPGRRCADGRWAEGWLNNGRADRGMDGEEDKQLSDTRHSACCSLSPRHFSFLFQTLSYQYSLGARWRSESLMPKSFSSFLFSSIHPSTHHPSIYPSNRPSNHPPVHPTICSPICQSIFLIRSPTHLPSTLPAVNPCICPSIHRSNKHLLSTCSVLSTTWPPRGDIPA